MAKLPVEYLERRIEKMIPGEVWWTVPWAAWIDDDHNLWLNGHYTAHRGMGGTVEMQVWLVRDGEYGIRYTGTNRWDTRGPAERHPWFGHSFPVVEFNPDPQ